MIKKQNIQIYADTKECLDKLKLSKSETYNEVIQRLINNYDISDMPGFELTNGLFKIECEVDFEDEHWYFIDELGNTSEILKPTESFIDKGIQNEYNAFIKAIHDASNDDLNLLDYGADLGVGDVAKFNGFIMRRTY